MLTDRRMNEWMDGQTDEKRIPIWRHNKILSGKPLLYGAMPTYQGYCEHADKRRKVTLEKFTVPNQLKYVSKFSQPKL